MMAQGVMSSGVRMVTPGRVQVHAQRRSAFQARAPKAMAVKRVSMRAPTKCSAPKPAQQGLGFNPLNVERKSLRKNVIAQSIKHAMVNMAAAEEDDTIKLVPAAISIAVGVIVKLLVPIPAGLTVQAWDLLAIFLSTVVGLVLKPMPVGAWAFAAATFTILSGTLNFATTFAALTNEVIWLIVVATIFARAFVKTGFGDRLALFFVKIFGKTTLSLAYGLQAAEVAICPAVPSTTARAGGVFVPIINSLDPRARGFLIGQQLQGGNNTSSILLTAAAQNFLCIKLAEELGVVFTNPFNQWLMAAIVPCVLAIIATPLVIYLFDPPGVKDTPEAPIEAEKQLKEMGGMKDIEKKMIAGLGVTVVLWVFGTQLGISAVLAAMIGLCILLSTGVVTWDDALSEKGAWDTLVWFAVLIGMSAQLNALGVVGWLSSSVSSVLTSMSLGWPAAFGLLHLGYFVLHYLFASQTAHVGALYSAFLGMMLASGAPPVLAALTLAFNTNLFGAVTHFASGQSAVYFAAGHLELGTLWKQGVYCAITNFLIWGFAGALWWKAIGLY
mmetsp:Transcript_33071/g.72108  ORF Transcript_33071/g.72108 Transcript_33071/m.72108 type:complete len:555 (-) Transcript_33071:90-1754(-)|eukprot:CAMPEP_0118926624 /NCGR_PEP_ID=MMETSP1169-20130426/4274_1 /TAXON_ID=36882 /ORGANISM="Pyramimonas obovata, Strain CCMP722" /LENGTH=554 /DNA_ID=CAMNT_0006868217 /DNA_START=27 /DNA_END=1691 /DNA_ORIENTATION=-